MRTFKAMFALAALAAGAGLYAQSTPSSSSSPAMDPNAPALLRGDAEAVYGFRFKQTGVAVDLGSNLAPGQFIGLENTYFRLTDSQPDPFSGRIHSTETIDILGLTYRYSTSLGRFSDDLAAWPLRFYLGGGAGMSWVKLNTSNATLGYYTSDRDEGVFGAEGNTGLEWWVTRNLGVKAGFRYIYLHGVQLYGQKGNIDTGAVEGGVTFRF